MSVILSKTKMDYQMFLSEENDYLIYDTNPPMEVA